MTGPRRGGAPSECDGVRELLWPLDAPRACLDGEEEARAHLAACPACREFFERDAAIARALRELQVRERAPRALRERVFYAIARERSRTMPRPAATRARSLAARAAAVALGVVVLALGLFALPGDGHAGSAFAQDYLSRAVQQRRVDHADSAEISRFFLGEFGERIEPRRLPTARISRAMICLIEGRRAAMVEYLAGESVLAHYRIPLRPGSGRRVVGVRTESEGGIQAIRWSDDRFEHALVSELPERELERIARSRFSAR